jgi:NAD(P)-dependent dehydrogenase (short-subunit alcohol dehydrogenase family)
MNILITGASRGIGREMVEQFLKQDSKNRVIALSMNADKLMDLHREYGNRLIAAPISVSEETAKAEIKKLFESGELKGEGLDLLINNAGTYPKEPDDFERVSIDLLQQGFEVNTYAAFRTTQACLPYLKKSKNPVVASITSLMGSISDNTSGGSYAYRMSKAALNMFNKSFSVDHPEITAIVFHPGWVQTEMGGSSAPTTVAESASGMLKVLKGLKKSDSGKFFDYEGDPIAW